MTPWLYENPIPLAVLLGAVAAFLVFRAVTGGGRRELLLAATAAGLSAGALLVGRTVVTPGEHARATTERLVDAAVAAKVDDAYALFTPDAVLNYGRRESQGVSLTGIRRALESLATVNRIDSNRITRLDFQTLDASTGEAELLCSTGTVRSTMMVPTRWIVRVRRIGDAAAGGSWRIDRITFVSLFGKPPPQNLW
ncbi:MAG: hypothetical protein RL136_182 [Planctomycetota bacterium]|jgi:hypothetical protein